MADGKLSGPAPKRAREFEEISIKMKVVKDSIHGLIELHPLLVKIIDSPQFQRLRHIKQLGGVYWVYPGASHNRFEHSIGMAYLAGCLVENLDYNQPELKITPREKMCVQIAALCSNLGHGPFSKMFEKRVIPGIRDASSNTHRELSVRIFTDMVPNEQKEQTEQKEQYELEAEMKKNGIKPAEDYDIIKNIIRGISEGSGDKTFLYEIVANNLNGIDVSKCDYFARDSHHLGISNSFDHMRLLKSARVCNVDGKNHICFRDKEADNIYEMFRTRYNLHRQAYQHKTVSVIEILIKNAFIEANEHLKISAAIGDIKEYNKLTDKIFEDILYSTNDELKNARQILQDVVKRRLPKCVGEGRLPEIRDEKDKQAIQEDLMKSWSKAVEKWNENNSTEFSMNDFKIDVVEMDHGMKSKNPFTKIYFYNKEDTKKAARINAHQVSSFLPKHFHERRVRVYYQNITDETEKNSEEESSKLENLKTCFMEWGKKSFGLPGCIIFFETSDFDKCKRYECEHECQDLQKELKICQYIRVKSGTWVLYKNKVVDDLKYILKKGCYDSLPLWKTPEPQSPVIWSCKMHTNLIVLYDQDNCIGKFNVITDDIHLPENHFQVHSCWVVKGSWMLSSDDIGEGFILNEGRHNSDVWVDTVPIVKSLTYISETI